MYVWPASDTSIAPDFRTGKPSKASKPAAAPVIGTGDQLNGLGENDQKPSENDERLSEKHMVGEAAARSGRVCTPGRLRFLGVLGPVLAAAGIFTLCISAMEFISWRDVQPGVQALIIMRYGG